MSTGKIDALIAQIESLNLMYLMSVRQFADTLGIDEASTRFGLEYNAVEELLNRPLEDLQIIAKAEGNSLIRSSLSRSRILALTDIDPNKRLKAIFSAMAGNLSKEALK